jgi:hypothetical protein
MARRGARIMTGDTIGLSKPVVLAWLCLAKLLRMS